MFRFALGAAIGAGLMYGYLFHYSTDMPQWMKGAAAGYNDQSTRDRLRQDGLD